MTDIRQTVEAWKKAYRVLNVPETASALAIKSNYRKLIKRWHPDRPATAAATGSEAVMMTKLINEAYEQIQNAPLRYYVEETTKKPTKKTTTGPTVRGVNEVDLSKMFFNEKRIEYAVRIVCGALAGAFAGLAISLDSAREGMEIMLAVAVCAVGFAVGAVKYGDKFWRGFLGKWWMWE